MYAIVYPAYHYVMVPALLQIMLARSARWCRVEWLSPLLQHLSGRKDLRRIGQTNGYRYQPVGRRPEPTPVLFLQKLDDRSTLNPWKSATGADSSCYENTREHAERRLDNSGKLVGIGERV